MEIKKITQILCLAIVGLNTFGLLIISQTLSYIVDEIAELLVIEVLIITIVLNLIAYWISLSIKNMKFPSILLFIGMSSQIFMLVFNSIIYWNFWFSGFVGIQLTQINAILTILISFFAGLLFWADTLPIERKKSFILKLKTKIKPFLLSISSIWVYMPIIAGILYPMVYMFPLAYSSWIIFQSWEAGSWVDSWIVIFSWDSSFRVDILLIIEIIIFIVGLLLFFWGLIHLVKGKKIGLDIVQTGPYKLIRHPQNLGILIMLFPFALYTPSFIGGGIRIGDILSWTLFFLLMIFISDFEEYRLKEKFPEEFQNYRVKTGFIFPKLRNKEINQVNDQKNYYLKRYGFLILGYVIFILITYFIVQDLLNKGILVQTR